ncbi:hypothetical protein NPX13_g6097 [Xylaria arbuscula]|uniref:TauD/TfdA-like domain-containing protein n=1 Tax=Xylaria arbuscula TaxID=114810 RepID=A0A9W8ND66_9PEZI|nr:hypothetical protein NPX13_g6097 [Xylaria arbuscula]
MMPHAYPVSPHAFAGRHSRSNDGEWELGIPSSPGRNELARLARRPPSIKGSAVWSAVDRKLFKPSTLELGPADVAEVEQALKHFLGLGLDGSEVSRENFPLPVLGSQLRDCAVEIHQGSGVFVIRGLVPEKYSAEDNTILFLGLASYIGDQRGVQSSKGAMLTHVYESKSWTVPREKRHGIHTNKSLPFHNDMGCEILAIHVRSCAAQGGQTYVASAAEICTRRGDFRFVLAPLIEFKSGHIVMSVDPGRIGPHPAVTDGKIPELLPSQALALALLQETARTQQIRLPTRRGDMVFINNWSVLHARESYQDDGSATRHLVRLWLRNSELSLGVPESMKTAWDASFGTKAERVVNKQYPVAPMPEYMEPKFTNGSAAFIVDSDDEVLGS